MQIPHGEYLLALMFTEVSYFTNLHFHIHHTTKCPTKHCHMALKNNNLLIS